MVRGREAAQPGPRAQPQRATGAAAAGAVAGAAGAGASAGSAGGDAPGRGRAGARRLGRVTDSRDERADRDGRTFGGNDLCDRAGHG